MTKNTVYNPRTHLINHAIARAPDAQQPASESVAAPDATQPTEPNRP
jgi:hypothetical protein